ncbi:MAG TPA: hypothetical protein VFD98_09250, partial [Terracidiphilus sp.]|nr:hypothetical protein [Terracidiphilus sp.]
AAGPGLRGQILELGGPDNLTFNQLAVILQETTGRRGVVRHIPRPALQLMAGLTAAVKPALARQARAALAMDTIDMGRASNFPDCGSFRIIAGKDGNYGGEIPEVLTRVPGRSSPDGSRDLSCYSGCRAGAGD